MKVTSLLWLPKTAVRHTWMKTLAADGLPGVQFTEPAGDPGLYGPDSEIWYAHSDVVGLVGGLSGLLLGALHEPTLYGTNQHSSYSDDPVARLGRTASFVNAMTWGATPVVDRVCDLVRTMHQQVHGSMPDGRTYDANDDDQLIWTAMTQAHSIIRAHVRYHPDPLDDLAIDNYYAQYAQFAVKLGATKPVPSSAAEVEQYFRDMRPLLACSEETTELADFLRRPLGTDLPAKAASVVIMRAAFDNLPDWAQRLYGVRPASRLTAIPRAIDTQITRQSALVLLTTLRWALGESPIQTQARERSLATPA